LKPFRSWISAALEENINITKEERLNEIYKIETYVKLSKKEPEEILLIELIFQFVHGKENLKKDLFINFRN
jgi:hypothetical protein